MKYVICTLFGHHPDGLAIVPLGFTIDGDFLHLRVLRCVRCGTQVEEVVVTEPLPVWVRDA